MENIEKTALEHNADEIEKTEEVAEENASKSTESVEDKSICTNDDCEYCGECGPGGRGTYNYDTEDDKVQERYHIPRIARFEKVSFETFLAAFKPMWIAIMKAQQGIEAGDSFAYNEDQLVNDAMVVYNNIKLPRRSTRGSAGYDFSFPFGSTELNPGVSVLIPTGIKCEIAEGWVLKEYPRSSLGFNYRIQLDNTVGIIDSDYYNNPKNEGHIMIKITNDSRENMTCVLETGSKFCQGIFVPYGITVDDDVTEVREGGLGSTGA